MYKLTKDNKAVIRKSDGARITLPPGESEGYEYQDWLNLGNEPEPAQTETEILEESLKNVSNKLGNEKRNARDNGILIDGVLFDTDQAARISYIEFMIKLMMNPAYSVTDWKASEGVWVTMDNVLFQKVILAWEQKLTSIFSFVKSKETEINSKSTKEELDNISLDFN